MTGESDNVSERVLLVAPTGRDAGLAASALRAEQIGVTACRSVSDAISELATGAGALLLAVEALDAKRVQQLAEWIARQPPGRTSP